MPRLVFETLEIPRRLAWFLVASFFVDVGGEWKSEIVAGLIL